MFNCSTAIELSNILWSHTSFLPSFLTDYGLNVLKGLPVWHWLNWSCWQLKPYDTSQTSLSLLFFIENSFMRKMTFLECNVPSDSNKNSSSRQICDYELWPPAPEHLTDPNFFLLFANAMFTWRENSARTGIVKTLVFLTYYKKIQG